MHQARDLKEAIGDWLYVDGSPISKRAPGPSYAPLATMDDREAFWGKVLSIYGWNGSGIESPSTH
jgi:hypothetical protein